MHGIQVEQALTADARRRLLLKRTEVGEGEGTKGGPDDASRGANMVGKSPSRRSKTLIRITNATHARNDVTKTHRELGRLLLGAAREVVERETPHDGELNDDDDVR